MKSNHTDYGKLPKLTNAQKELYDWLVQYIEEHRYSPSIRQMMEAMNLRSPAPVQSRLERLKNKGYIDWTAGKARTIAILHPEDSEGSNIRIVGTIAAGGLVTPINDLDETFGLGDILTAPGCYALRVTGDSMIGDLIMEGDLVIMKSQQDQN
ncbi:MAG: repressor LexA, partial [Synechococcaceae cyanobacterium RL_1_2]|nr:repressor LexA [Synechococcaceae cyanobacterium RL_1_2]